MKRSRLLKLLFDFVGRLIANAEDHAADEAVKIRRIFQASRERGLHPCSRNLRRSHDSTPAAAAENPSVFRITDDQGVANVPPRQIRVHVELTGIARAVDKARHAEELKFVAEPDIATPADGDGCAR